MSSRAPAMSSRCVSHPARPAYEQCPVCTRPRCRSDADSYGGSGCGVCTQLRPAPRRAGRCELLVRAGLTGLAVAFLGGWVATQYVRVHLMSLAAPGLVGIAAGVAVPAAARVMRPRALGLVIAAAAALAGTALGFALVPGGQEPLRPWSIVGGPYLAALVGVVLGPVVVPGPRRPGQPPADGDGAADGELDRAS